MTAESPRFRIQKNVLSLTKIAVNAFRVAPQWQIPTIGFATISAYEMAKVRGNLQDGNVLKAIPHTTIALGSALIGIFGQCMTIEYVGEYEKIKGKLKKNGWDKRIIEQHTEYFCGKRAAMIAANDTGHGDKFKEYLRTT